MMAVAVEARKNVGAERKYVGATRGAKSAGGGVVSRRKKRSTAAIIAVRTAGSS